MAKSKPIGVRFDLHKLDIIQKKQNLTSMQSVLDYLMDFYLAHSQSDKIIAELDKIKTKRGAPFKNMPPYDIRASNLADKVEIKEIPIENDKTPPRGLKGVDLVIWKIENKKPS
jgi:hypothetical protein